MNQLTEVEKDMEALMSLSDINRGKHYADLQARIVPDSHYPLEFTAFGIRPELVERVGDAMLPYIRDLSAGAKVGVGPSEFLQLRETDNSVTLALTRVAIDGRVSLR